MNIKTKFSGTNCYMKNKTPIKINSKANASGFITHEKFDSTS